METRDLIKKAKDENRTALTEAESKKLLSAYGLPVVEEAVAMTTEEAVNKADAFGFPVVLKGLGAKLTHKTEMGLVHLGLNTPDAVRKAAHRISTAAGTDLEGFLVQPHLSGRREFVAGLFHDPQFGPIVMFGLGGIFTEALDDVVFRVAPLDESEAGRMLDELKSKRLLSAFRGEKPADRDALVKALVGLSRLGLEVPEITEVDVNPLIVTPDGRPVAVDALVILGEKPSPERLRPPVDPSKVGHILYPRSVAFVGASGGFSKWGNRLFTNALAGGYQGEIYLVNPKGEPIAGRPVYKSVAEIPGSVDLAVVTIPAAKVMALLPELHAKGIKGMVLITSGFGETGPEGRKLEMELVEEARRLDILILGPNTMGISNPHKKFHCIGTHTRPQPGSTAFVSQSGNMGTQLLAFAERQGIGIRAFGGSGNEAMFTIEDALDAFAVDELTATVLLYIESVKNGRRFFESARQVSRRKPVVVLKGGRTEAGGKAAASHTGAMASNVKVFNAACRQAGIVLADQPMDMLDLSAAFSALPLPRGRRVAIMTLGGGWGVVTSDICSEFGLEVPTLSTELVERIDKILPPFWSRANPVDLVGEPDPVLPVTIMDELLAWDGCDAVIHLGIFGWKHVVKAMVESSLKVDPTADPAYLQSLMAALEGFEQDYIRHIVSLMEKHKKPVLGVGLITDADARNVYEIEGAKYKGVFFPTPERAVKALAEMYKYEVWLDNAGVPVEERGVAGQVAR